MNKIVLSSLLLVSLQMYSASTIFSTVVKHGTRSAFAGARVCSTKAVSDLCEAVRWDDLDKLREAVAADPRLLSKVIDEDGNTLLHEAAFHDAPRAAGWLLDMRVDRVEPDRLGYTPLMKSVQRKRNGLTRSGNWKVLHRLMQIDDVRAGVNQKAYDEGDDHTALTLLLSTEASPPSYRKELANAVWCLLNAGADPNISVKSDVARLFQLDGTNALEIAALCGDPNLVVQLLKSGKMDLQNVLATRDMLYGGFELPLVPGQWVSRIMIDDWLKEEEK